MLNPILKFNYEKNLSLVTESKSFKEAIAFILNRKEPAAIVPIKMTEIGSGKIYYFDQTKFQSFIAGELYQDELLEECVCDGLFRNDKDIEISQEEIIDKGSLWKLNSKKLLLVSSERFVELDYPTSNFTEI